MRFQYQFARFEIYSKKKGKSRTTAEAVCAEAARIQGWCGHITQPQLPNILFGECPSTVMQTIEMRITLLEKKGGRGKGIRCDTRILGGMVLSFPASPSDLSDPTIKSEYLAWRERVLDFFKNQAKLLGMRLLSVVEHTDETFLHLHALYCANNGRLDMKMHHPGYLAKHKVRQMVRTGLKATISETAAYKAAMRKWQDHVFEQVSSRHGLLRLGPQRTRYSAETRKAREVEVKAMGDRIRKLDIEQKQIKDEKVAVVRAKLAVDAERQKVSKDATKMQLLLQKQRAKEVAMDAVCEDEIIGAVLGDSPERSVILFSRDIPKERRQELVEAISPAVEEALRIIVKMTNSDLPDAEQEESGEKRYSIARPGL